METSQENPSDEQREKDTGLKWAAPSTMPVYGWTPGCPPPDFEQPFVQEAAISPNSGYAPQPQAAPQQAHGALSEPMNEATMEPETYQQPEGIDPWLPHPFGPALTPEQRLQYLYGLQQDHDA